MSDPSPQSEVPELFRRVELVTTQSADFLANHLRSNLAVIIGINQYKYVPQLETARPDAERLAELLQDTGRDAHDRYEVIPLYDEEATLKALRTLLTETLPQHIAAAGAETRLLFYYAGHGDAQDDGDGLRGFLFPQDAQLDDEKTLLPMDEVQDAIAGLACHHILLS